MGRTALESDAEKIMAAPLGQGSNGGGNFFLPIRTRADDQRRRTLEDPAAVAPWRLSAAAGEPAEILYVHGEDRRHIKIGLEGKDFRLGIDLSQQPMQRK